MQFRVLIALATFLALVPVTLLVPGLHELVVVSHGGSEGDAHAFMTVNMIAGMISVPVVMRFARRSERLRWWIVGALALDAVAFVGMGLAASLPALYAFRVLEGAAHLPAVTLLMVASNRASGERRGGSLGALAAAIMIGVAVGSPVGGWLIGLGASAVYGVGATLLVVAAAVASRMRTVPADACSSRSSRYEWNRRSLETWVPLAYGFLDRFTIGIFVSTFTLYLTSVVGLTAPQRGVLIALFMLPFALLCYPAGRLADRCGWFVPMLVGNVLFGLVFASYGFVPQAWLPVAMVASGVFSAMMFTPNLLLISDLVKRGHGEGLFGAFQVAGSLGFLTGPVVGGILVSVTRDTNGVPAYREILLAVGLLAALLAAASFSILRRFAAERRGERSVASDGSIIALVSS